MKISEKSRELLGSRVTVKVVNDDDALALLKIDEALEECERIEKLYSRFISGNVLAHLNERVGEWTQVSPELFYLLKFAEKVGLQTGGAFDLSVKSVLEGWGYDSDYSLTEGDAGACGEMEFSKGRVLISAEIDLGGLGKGYAIDLMRKILDGFDNFLIDAGGDIFAKGKGPDGETWKLVFEDPKDVSRAIGQVR
ncbi:FAD:protein FMN transferase, partial [Candidatus Peregrinibacteria bacterium]|nr:FAD:protein FMN transferase [Candidatus Peregrinibacteria bacterium]